MRDAGFERVRQAIDAGVGGQPLRHRHDELGIDDGHVGRQRVVRQGNFAMPRALSSHHREGSDFAARCRWWWRPRSSRSRFDLPGGDIAPRAYGCPGTARPTPRGRLRATRSFNFMIFAASMIDPPPSATIWSAR